MLMLGCVLDTYELIFFKRVIMIDTTNFYILIPVWMTLTFTQNQRIMIKLKLVLWLL